MFVRGIHTLEPLCRYISIDSIVLPNLFTVGCVLPRNWHLKGPSELWRYSRRLAQIQPLTKQERLIRLEKSVREQPFELSDE